MIWNEPNSSRFWRPQFGPDGTSLAPAAYEALLARCWDVLHAARPSVNVIAASSPRGNDNPAASSNVSHSPVNFYLKLGDAYRASGRRLPIFDTVGHNPYPLTNAERPWVRHTRPAKTIAEGDYDKLMARAPAGLRRHRPAAARPEAGTDLVHGAGLPDLGRPGQDGRSTAAPRPSDRCCRRSSPWRRDARDRRARARPGDAAVRRAPASRTASLASAPSSTSSSPTSGTWPAGSPGCSGPT